MYTIIKSPGRSQEAPKKPGKAIGFMGLLKKAAEYTTSIKNYCSATIPAMLVTSVDDDHDQKPAGVPPNRQVLNLKKMKMSLHQQVITKFYKNLILKSL